MEWFNGLDYSVVLALVFISFLGSFISGALGIGGGVLVLSVLALFLPPPALIPVHGLIQLGSNASRVLLMVKYLKRSVFIPFLIGSVFGVALGSLIVINLPPGVLLIGVGLFVLWSVLIAPSIIRLGSPMVAGGISSFLTMFFGATGPLIAAWLKSFNFDRLVHVANQSFCMTVQHLLKTVAFVVLGFAFLSWLPLVGLMIAAGFLGTLIGGGILKRTNEAQFKVMLNIVLTILALQLIWRGAAKLFSA